jgi:hypothetical protein
MSYYDDWEQYGRSGPLVKFSCPKCGESYGVGQHCSCHDNNSSLNLPKISSEESVKSYFDNVEIIRQDKEIKELKESVENLKKNAEGLAKALKIEVWKLDRIAAILKSKGHSIDSFIKEYGEEQEKNPDRFNLLEVD